MVGHPAEGPHSARDGIVSGWTGYATEGWGELFLAEAGASAALGGLLFVAVSINLQRICESPKRGLGGSLPGFGVRHRGMTHNGSGAQQGCLGDELSAVVPASTWPTALLA
jgi:hypothetical protein